MAFGNISDFGTNLEFVRHVLAMDTTNFGAEPGTALDPHVMWRATTASGVQTAAYIGIIGWESAAVLVLFYATFLWITSRRSRTFEAPRHMASFGPLMLIIFFMEGFITIGGEWFQMRQGPNGLFRFAPAAVAVTHAPCLYRWSGGATTMLLHSARIVGMVSGSWTSGRR